MKWPRRVAPQRKPLIGRSPDRSWNWKFPDWTGIFSRNAPIAPQPISPDPVQKRLQSVPPDTVQKRRQSVPRQAQTVTIIQSGDQKQVYYAPMKNRIWVTVYDKSREPIGVLFSLEGKEFFIKQSDFSDLRTIKDLKIKKSGEPRYIFKRMHGEYNPSLIVGYIRSENKFQPYEIIQSDQQRQDNDIYYSLQSGSTTQQRQKRQRKK